MGGINFGWLAVCVPSPDWLCRILKEWDVCQALRWSRCALGREFGSCPVFASKTLAFALQLRKIKENRSQGKWMALHCSAPNTTRSFDSAIAGDGLDWPAAPATFRFRVRGRGQTSFCLSIWRVAVLGCSAHQLTLSQSSRSGLWCGRQTAERPDHRVSACYVPRGTSSEAKQLRL